MAKSVMGWTIGQRVCCTRDDFVLFPDVHPGRRVMELERHETPRKGKIYTIRGFNRNTRTWKIDGTLGLYLEEIKNPILVYTDGSRKELSFDIAGFEPVQESTKVAA
jgi:hypothetical protein